MQTTIETKDGKRIRITTGSPIDYDLLDALEGMKVPDILNLYKVGWITEFKILED